MGAGLLPFNLLDYYRPGVLPVIFLFGPALYLYLSSLTIENFRLKPFMLLHLLPFVVVSIHRSIVGPVSVFSNSDLSGNPLFFYNKIYYSLFVILLFIYWFLGVRLVIKHRRNIPYHFSNFNPGNTMNWSIIVLSLFVIFFIADLSMPLIYKALNIPNIPLLPTSLTVLTFIIIFFGNNQTIIYPDHIKSQDKKPLETESDHTVIKERNLLDEKQIEELSEMVFRYLKVEQPYLNPEYSLQMMVEDLNISRQKLSYLINNGQKKNFYKLINEFRVQEVKERLSNPDFKQYTLLGIGLKCGFNSKTSFNRIFKEETGFTPTEFKKQSTVY